MLIYALDDEPLLLESLRRSIQTAAPEARVRGFERVSALLAAITQEGQRPDLVFSDIEMPGMSGLELAVKIKNLCPQTRLVFVTGYPQYALEAYRLHVGGYILKPVTPERVAEELAQLPARPPAADTGKLQVRCFGYFEVFWQGEPLTFARSRTKELFAYLVDREGAACTAEEIILAIWEEDGDLKRRKSYLRALTADLRTTLAAIGMEEALIRQHNQWAVRTELLDCDYYRMRGGDMTALNAYRGEYMMQYSWAELTGGKLYFKK